MEVKDIVTLIGIGLTFSVGLLNLMTTFRNAKKTTFINSITASRLKYIQEIREKISKFCGLVYSYNNRNTSLSDAEKWNLHRESDNVRFLIRLYLDPEDAYWDKEIMRLINDIIVKTDKDPSKEIDELITITQYVLKLEWEGAKRESEIGILSDVEKRSLYEKYVEKHKKVTSSV